MPVIEEIKRLIENRVNPSFLDAHLMLNELLEEHKTNDLGVDRAHEVLLPLPASLEDMYNPMLQDHSQLAAVPQERQVLILQLAIHASCSLLPLETSTVSNFLDMN